MHKIDVAGLKVDSISKPELIRAISDRTKTGQKTFVITPYSEFVYRSLQNRELFDVLNQADFSVPDGIGLFWARKFLSLPFSAKSFYGKIFQAFWQMVYSGAAIIFYPSWIKSAFAEKIPGSDLIWDLAELASEEQRSIYLLGGFGDTPKLVKDKSTAKFPNLTIAGYSSKNPNDPTIIEDIKKANPDFLLVAFGPINQEQWIVQYKNDLPCKLFIGLGGTFDYIAGKKINPPKWVRSLGLEWFYRLITQPYRLKRIWQATVGLISMLIRYKVFNSLPYRPNVVAVVLNKENQVLVVKVNPTQTQPAAKTFGNFPANYWIFPQGGTDGEDVGLAAMRETKEETGITTELIKISHHTHAYDWKVARPLFTNQRYQYRGQLQHIAYLRFSGEKKAVKVDNWELVDFKWVPVNELRNVVHKNREQVVKLIQADLQDLRG